MLIQALCVKSLAGKQMSSPSPGACGRAANVLLAHGVAHTHPPFLAALAQTRPEAWNVAMYGNADRKAWRSAASGPMHGANRALTAEIVLPLRNTVLAGLGTRGILQLGSISAWQERIEHSGGLSVAGRTQNPILWLLRGWSRGTAFGLSNALRILDTVSLSANEAREVLGQLFKIRAGPYLYPNMRKGLQRLPLFPQNCRNRPHDSGNWRNLVDKNKSLVGFFKGTNVRMEFHDVVTQLERSIEKSMHPALA